MKKIISLIMMVAVLFSFATVSFAANEAPFALTPETSKIALGDGTTDVEVTFAITIDEDVTASMFSAMLVFDAENVTIKSIDTDEFGAVMAFNSGYSDATSGMLTFMNDDAATVYPIAAGTYNIPMVLTVNNKKEASYTISFDENTMLVADDWATPINDCATYPTATITVEAQKEEGPTVIVPTAATLTDVVDAEYWQKGQAVAMSFNVADLASFAGMSWKLNLAKAGAKYAPVAFDAATIAAIGTPEVQFVASFVVNTEADVDGDVIDSVEAGFCDADKALVAKTTPVAITALN